MKPLHGQEAYVIHSRHYRETSVLLTCFVAHLGKMNLLAKGVRTARSPLKALLQPFMPLMISFQGRTDLKLLTQCEMYGDWSPLKGSSLACGLYLNELLYTLLPAGIEYARLFECYQQTLIGLSQGRDQAALLRLFEMHLLAELGYALQLTHDMDGAPIQAHVRYSYLPKAGARPLVHEAAKGIAGKTLLDLARHDLADPVSALEAQHLLRPVIEHLLEGKPIQSRAIWV